jgi:hypothetical protein
MKFFKGMRHSAEVRAKMSAAHSHPRKPYVLKNSEDGCLICVSHKVDVNGINMITVRKKRVKMLRYMWEQRFGKIPEGLVLRHSCDNARCLNFDHVSLGTSKDNTQDAVVRGRIAYGERQGSAKLNDEIAVDIYKSNESNQFLAEKYRVSKSTIRSIKTGLNWSRATKGFVDVRRHRTT